MQSCMHCGSSVDDFASQNLSSKNLAAIRVVLPRLVGLKHCAGLDGGLLSCLHVVSQPASQVTGTMYVRCNLCQTVQTESYKKPVESITHQATDLRKQSPSSPSASYIGLHITREQAVTSVLSGLLPIPKQCVRSISESWETCNEVTLIISELRADVVLVRIPIIRDDWHMWGRGSVSCGGSAGLCTAQLCPPQAQFNAFFLPDGC